MPVPRALIEALPRLKLILVTGAHNRTLDLEAALSRDILVSHTRSAGTERPTCELTWGADPGGDAAHCEENQSLRAGGWQITVGATLSGRTLGVLGLGRLGAAVSAIGAAFGMKVLAWSPNLTAERAAAGGAELVAKSELFSRSDVVTLHMVLSERRGGWSAQRTWPSCSPMRCW